MSIPVPHSSSILNIQVFQVLQNLTEEKKNNIHQSILNRILPFHIEYNKSVFRTFDGCEYKSFDDG